MVLVTVATACTAVTATARAMGPIGVEIAARGGASTNPQDAIIHPYGPGFGARAGATLSGFYAGLSAMYYLGPAREIPLVIDNSQMGTPQLATISVRTLLLGVEAGYGWKLGALTLRPQLGIGRASYIFSATVGGATDLDWATDNCLYLEPAFVALVSLGTVFVGADTSVLAVTGTLEARSYVTITAHAQIGVAF